MNLAVDKPVLNSPYEEPTQYWLYEQGQPKIMAGRRPAGYYFKARARGPKDQMTLYTEEQFVELDTVNRIRQEVAKWRQAGYQPTPSPVTRRLLQHWQGQDREFPLFFCQREAVETIIWLVEVHAKNPKGLRVPQDEPLDAASQEKGYKALRRYGCKMATGSGKTVVMAMLIAWSVLNKAQNPQDKRFSDAILVVCPNLTIKQRLAGDPDNADSEKALIPGAKGNYYDRFEIVPPGLKDHLGKARIAVMNWHKFLPRDDSRKRGVVQRGAESDTAFAARVLKGLGPKKNLLVLNDEAHHAYRPAPLDEEARKKLTAAQAKEREEATEWIGGLDRIHAARGTNFCVDLSATPYYIQGSGYDEGKPLPWLVSDFGLVDAIECGIVKIPRVPVDDNTGQPIPKYFALWQAINDALPPGEKARARRKPKPEGVLREAEGALQQLAGLWKETFEQWEKERYPVPPVMIVVCDNTNIAQVMHEFISGESLQEVGDRKKKRTVYGTGHAFPELLGNSEAYQPAIRIDTKLLAEAESRADGGTQQQAAEELRLKVATVGKQGEPGEQVRCVVVVSVGMLTEGWDASNVKQILGLRAFQSQLLCEQVVGRGLRRVSYEVDRKTGLLTEDYVDVYGIPFEVIPVKKKTTGGGGGDQESTLVQALPERKASFEMHFPRVEGFVFEVKSKIKADVAGMPLLTVDPSKEPTETLSRTHIGYLGGAPSVLGPGEIVRQNRNPFYAERRLQQSEFEIARLVTDALVGGEAMSGNARHLIFPQVLGITREYVRTRVEYIEAPPNEIALEKYRQLIVERLCAAIEPDETHGEVPLRPRLEQFRPKGSTSEVLFRTVRPCKGTIRSHVSHVVLDAPRWEASVAYRLEKSNAVQAYVRNDHMDLVIPYEYQGQQWPYTPDFLVRLSNGVTLVLEVKGYEDEQDRAKYAGALRWVSAVNHWGEMGQWRFAVCKDPPGVGETLKALALEAVAGRV